MGTWSVLTGHIWTVDNTQHVVYIGSDHHVHELWFELWPGQPHVWRHNDLTAAAQAPNVLTW
jgi:hypothetical protein